MEEPIFYTNVKGGILQDSRGRRFIVCWNKKCSAWHNEPIDDKQSYPGLNVGTTKCPKIVVNIHDNPEMLLEGKQIKMNI